jgi:hypothetical protein
MKDSHRSFMKPGKVKEKQEIWLNCRLKSEFLQDILRDGGD